MPSLLPSPTPSEAASPAEDSDEPMAALEPDVEDSGELMVAPEPDVEMADPAAMIGEEEDIHQWIENEW